MAGHDERRETKAAKVRSDAADATLGRQQAANGAKLARAQPRIDALEAVKPTDDVATNAAGINDDSKAAWENWR